MAVYHRVHDCHLRTDCLETGRSLTRVWDYLYLFNYHSRTTTLPHTGAKHSQLKHPRRLHNFTLRYPLTLSVLIVCYAVDMVAARRLAWQRLTDGRLAERVQHICFYPEVCLYALFDASGMCRIYVVPRGSESVQQSAQRCAVSHNYTGMPRYSLLEIILNSPTPLAPTTSIALSLMQLLHQNYSVPANSFL